VDNDQHQGNWEFFEETKPASLSHVEDGYSNTTMLIERARLPFWYDRRYGDGDTVFVQGGGGGWALPNSNLASARWGINQSNVSDRYSHHPGGAQQAMLDGSVHFLSEGTDLTVLRAMDTRAGGEPVQWPR
jgi:prepilin-type processing-associated H-X9-DG protein